MADQISAPPPEAEGSGTEAEEAAWEIATAESLRARGDLAQAAMWYRRAANHLMEAGEDERAIAIAKLAAELAALDAAGRPSESPTSSSALSADEGPPTAPVDNVKGTKVERSAGPPPVPSQAASPKARTRSAAAANAGVSGSAEASASGGSKASVRPRGRRSTAPPPPRAPTKTASTASTAVPPPQPMAKTSTAVPLPRPPSKTASTAVPPAQPPAQTTLTGSTAVPLPRPSTNKASRSPIAKQSLNLASRSPSRQVQQPADDEATSKVDIQGLSGANDPDTQRIDWGNAVSPIAAMVDEAVSNIGDAPPAPLSATTDGTSARRPLAFRSERVAEAEQIFARLPALPLFAELPVDRLRSVARQVRIVRYQTGELLCESGAPEGPMFVVMEGTAYVNLAGQDTPVAVVTAGDVVGEVAALYGGPRTASVMVREPVEALAFAPSLVRALAREFPAFREALEEMARERMKDSLPRLAPAFRRFSGKVRDAVFSVFEMVAVPEGTLLFTEGEPAEAMYFVAAGEAELYGGDLSVTRTHHARVGEAVGVGSALTGEPAGVSARAARDMLLAKLPRTKVSNAVALHPHLSELLADVGLPGRGVLC